MPPNWRYVAAQITKFYGWGPHDARSLTWRDLMHWREDGERMLKESSNG